MNRMDGHTGRLQGTGQVDSEGGVDVARREMRENKME